MSDPTEPTPKRPMPTHRRVGVFLIIAPVVAVYMLLDWDRMVAGIDDLLPRDHAPVIRHLAAEIDRVLDVMPQIISGLREMSPFWSEDGAQPEGFNPEYA